MFESDRCYLSWVEKEINCEPPQTIKEKQRLYAEWSFEADCLKLKQREFYKSPKIKSRIAILKFK